MADLATPWALRVAATLRLAEPMAEGIETLDELAARAGANPIALGLLLRHLVSRGVFAEPKPNRFVLNEPARALLDPALRLGLDLDGLGGRMAHAWGTLLEFVRTGSPGYATLFGLPFWDDLDAHPDLAASFDEIIGPAGHGPFEPRFDLEGGWDGVSWVVDVGGGTGAMLAALLRLRPGLRGTLLDLPRTVARAGAILDAAGVADRVELAPQSFFDPLPCRADLYLLRGVLNDWSDHEAGAILRRCAEAAWPTGRVVVLKSVRPDDEPARLGMETLLAGGRNRTISEFRQLAAEAGLRVAGAGAQASGYFVVECRPA